MIACHNKSSILECRNVKCWKMTKCINLVPKIAKMISWSGQNFPKYPHLRLMIADNLRWSAMIWDFFWKIPKVPGSCLCVCVCVFCEGGILVFWGGLEWTPVQSSLARNEFKQYISGSGCSMERWITSQCKKWTAEQLPFGLPQTSFGRHFVGTYF